MHDVARRLAERGVVIISGGAIGVDRAAHEGALDAGGTTWAVLPHGASQSMATPLTNRDLFERIRASPTSRLLYPFSDEVTCDRQTPRARNKTLVGLADVVLVVQARLVSGSRNAQAGPTRRGDPCSSFLDSRGPNRSAARETPFSVAAAGRS